MGAITSSSRTPAITHLISCMGLNFVMLPEFIAYKSLFIYFENGGYSPHLFGLFVLFKIIYVKSQSSDSM